VVVDSVSGKLSVPPTFHARGFVENDAVFYGVIPQVRDALERAMTGGVTDSYQLQQIVRRTVGRWVNERYRRRPMIIPVVLEV